MLFAKLSPDRLPGHVTCVKRFSGKFLTYFSIKASLVKKIKKEGGSVWEGAAYQSRVYMVLIKLWTTKGHSVFSGVK